MRVSGEVLADIRRAILSGFDETPGDLKLAVDEAAIGKTWNRITYNIEGLDGCVEAVVKSARQQGQLTRLLTTLAEKYNPSLAPRLRQLARELKPLVEHATTLGVQVEELESIVLADVEFQDAGLWIDRLSVIRRAVCRVEPQPASVSIHGFGTGFLVEPDVVMTCNHVAKEFWSDPQARERVVFRFDYERLPDGTIGQGEEYRLAEDWRIFASPAPDFALLRVRAPQHTAERRQPIGLSSQAVTTDRPLLILQHPEARPLKLLFGQVRAAEGDRLSYGINTAGGSSGSPCLASDLQAVAVHYAAGNRAYTIRAICGWIEEELKAQGLSADKQLFLAQLVAQAAGGSEAVAAQDESAADCAPEARPPSDVSRGIAEMPAAPASLEAHRAQLLSAYHARVRQRWERRWSEEGSQSQPPYIETQELSLLLQTERPERFLHPEYFRVGRRAGSHNQQQDQGNWGQVDRGELVYNSLTADDGSRSDLSRLVITTDAGVGKTTTMEWLEAELNEPGSSTVAFCLPFSRLPARLEDFLPELAQRMLESAGVPPESATPEVAVQVVQTLRDQRRLVLLLDALDQEPPDGSAAELIRHLLDHSAWRGCRLVISGRPHALERHWSQLFATELGYGWRFAKVEEFTPDEQRRFLGTNDRGRSRLDLIPDEAREILSTPRVLSYLRALPDSDLRKIHTAGDVYWLSVQHLLVAGMQGSDDARRIGLDATEPTPAKVQARSKHRAQKVLAAIAFEMTSTRITRLDTVTSEPATAPNFEGVPRNLFPRFRQRLLRRLAPVGTAAGAEVRLEKDLDGLAALNEFVSQGLFDTSVDGMQEVFWRNRTLQEFFTALWLAMYCRPDDTTQLWDWLYLPDRPETEEYYWVWRFLCEMPDAARDPESWLPAVEPIYRPGDGTVEGTRRSSEFIYRAWQPLRELIDQGDAAALSIRRRFHGEFQSECLSDNRGDRVKEAARQFRDSFVDVPAGEFQMGAPPEKQGMDEGLREWWKEYLERDGDPAECAQQHIANWSFTPGRRGDQERQFELDWWTEVFRDKDLTRLEARGYPKDEAPLEPIQHVDVFRLSQCPTLNRWYRLFEPGHGEVDSSYPSTYEQMSPTPDCPVVFVSWYDAWSFAQWACWEGVQCRLPREYEWEYAAKAGTDWDQNYWWGEEFDPGKCNAEINEGQTMPPSASRANPWGFQDILGNVWEWCDDWYSRRYDRDATDEASVRVFRGGGWADDARHCRTACRSRSAPAYRNRDLGFRVAAVATGGALRCRSKPSRGCD